ncbi:MAG TPA: hypothetical protein VHQ01_03665 [Pyrinomonadaceae bacterium]|nr:hypothetical protein [Pyrinomonadaceae bacterium]
MGITNDTAALIFRIKADSSQAESEITQFSGKVSGLSKEFTEMLGPATIAAGAIAGIGIAAIGTVAAVARVSEGLFNLAKSASEYGSVLHDFKDKTGLAAATVSTLKYAADNASSSLEQVSSATAKFAKLIGQAADGNTAAQKTLKELGVTSYDLDTALAQVSKTIFKADDGTEQLSLAIKAFGKAGGDMIPVIKQMGGDLEKATAEAKRLGLVLSEEDLKAADDFGDTLGVLSQQAKVTASVFALQFAPVITDAMHKVSEALASNQDSIRTYGENFAATLRGMEYIASSATNSMIGSFIHWHLELSTRIDLVQAGLIGTIRLLQKLGGDAPLEGGVEGKVKKFSAVAGVEGVVGSAGKGGGGGGGGGGADEAARKAEEARKKAVKAAEKVLDEEMAVYKKGNELKEEQLKFSLDNQMITEAEYVKKRADLHYQAALAEKLKEQMLLTNKDITLNDEERAAILQKIKIAELEIQKAKLQGADEQNEQNRKEIAALDAKLAKEHAIANAKANAAANVAEKEKIAAIDKADREKRSMQRLGGRGTGFEGLMAGLQGDNQFKDNKALIAGVDTLSSAFGSLGDAVGQTVSALVLYGNAGTSVRKVTAEILASLAQQAAVKAVFELAEGFAALAAAFFGLPHAGPSAAAHFQSAAIYGSIAGIAAATGRGVAGNAFKDQTSSATGGNGSTQPAGPQTYGSQPINGGSGAVLGGNAVVNRLNMTVAALEETVGTLSARLDGIAPGDMLRIQIDQNPQAVADGYHGVLASSGQTAEQLARSSGRYR